MRALLPLTRVVLLALLAGVGPAALAQQKIGYIDSEFILQQLPEYQTALGQVDQLAQQWQTELQRLQGEVDALERDYKARELLFTTEERERKRQEIDAKIQERDQYRRRMFGPDGELFKEQQTRLRPVQERLLEAVETVASEGDYDYVFDRSGTMLFFFARPQHNVSTLVLEELGVTQNRSLGGN